MLWSSRKINWEILLFGLLKDLMSSRENLIRSLPKLQQLDNTEVSTEEKVAAGLEVSSDDDEDDDDDDDDDDENNIREEISGMSALCDI